MDMDYPIINNTSSNKVSSIFTLFGAVEVEVNVYWDFDDYEHGFSWDPS